MLIMCVRGGAGNQQVGPPADMMLEAPDTVHIAGLPEDINEDVVADFFGSFGPLKVGTCIHMGL
jgi:hypothetical protein